MHFFDIIIDLKYCEIWSISDQLMSKYRKRMRPPKISKILFNKRSFNGKIISETIANKCLTCFTLAIVTKMADRCCNCCKSQTTILMACILKPISQSRYFKASS